MTGTVNPALFGMPDATTTGPQAGVKLTPYTGPMTITTPGAVIENVTINGQLTIAAANVTIKNCVIQSNGSNGILADTASNLLVENCNIIGGNLTDNGILGHGTFIGNNISHVRIGIQLTDGASTVRDNYIHDQFMAISDPHYDGITVLGGQNHVVIEHNTISAPSDHGTAAILVQNVFGPVNDVQINNNLLLGTPSYAVYFEAKTTNGAITNAVFTDNYVERGAYGYVNTVNANPTMSGNVQWDSKTDPTPYPSSLPSSPSSPSSPTPIVDTTPPAAPKITADTVNSNNTVVASGTAEANSTIKVYDGTTQVGTATTNASGAWTVTTSALAAGTHGLTATATDVAGNVSAASQPFDPVIGGGSTTPPTTSPTPTPSKVIESAGATSLVESGDKYYLNSSSGSGPSLKYHGVDFVDGTDGTWAPIAAEKTTTGYQVVWKDASTGLYTAWNTDNNGNYVSHISTLTGSTSGGSVSGTNSGLKLLETSFHQDLNGDGQIGASSAAAPTQINSTGQVVATSGETMVGTDRSNTLTSTTGNDVMVGKGGADTFVFASNFGKDVITDFTAGGPSHDTVQFSKSVFDSFASVLSHAAQSGTDVVISTGSDTLTLKNTKVDALHSNDFHFA